MTTPNAELAYRVLDVIDADPNSWNQRAWISRPEGADCHTAGCFAGWACMLSGDKPDWEVQDDEVTDWVIVRGEREYIHNRAAYLLGIDRFSHANDLFGETNDREDLGRLVAEIFGPRPGGDSDAPR